MSRPQLVSQTPDSVTGALLFIVYSLFHQDLGVAFFQFARSLFKIF